jgi:hypothetical protein
MSMSVSVVVFTLFFGYIFDLESMNEWMNEWMMGFMVTLGLGFKWNIYD